jgi:'Cold-shock' DNA-binding domain
LGESLRRGRRKVCPLLRLIEIETASKLLFSLSVQNVSVCAKSNVGTLVRIYFHQNSVLNDAFSRLTPGTRVAFAEEIGEKGPQASSVRLLGKHSLR